jgi:glyoxylase-like metal-dependent hydrolase (beta-lactamase superfamily II)/8-oxo-dGTP pyrophosphatase MutT (NUDIX family)
MERRPADDPTPAVVARPAATVVLVRPGPDGLEVLLTRRPDSMAFAAGLQVFPGGRVDPADGVVDGSALHLAHRMAAIRETREEIGVVLADPHALVEIARWTTPRAYPRRFDARFFAAELPTGAPIVPDPREVAGHAWWTPRAALAAMARDEIAMWPPTSTTLQRLERASSFDQIRTRLARAPEAPIVVRRVDPGLAIVTGRSAFGPAGLPVNTVLVGRREVVVIDPGDPDEDVLDAIEAEVAAGGGRIVAIALTHVDPGHASGSEELSERTGLPIAVGPGGAAPLSWVVSEIADGAWIGRGDGRVTALTTPGHRPDHLAFLTPDGTLVAGDALSDRAGGPAALILPPEGDAAAQAVTIGHLRALSTAGAVRRIVPGHGPAPIAWPDDGE